MTLAPQVRSGPWDRAAVESFLVDTVIPVRLGTVGREGPLVQSLWFVYESGSLWCCTQADALVVRRLRADERVGFEVSRDEPPYRGVRGSGRAVIDADAARDVLPRLLDRYGIGRERGLGRWLLSRLDSEVAVRITDLAVTSWDYSARMSHS